MSEYDTGFNEHPLGITTPHVFITRDEYERLRAIEAAAREARKLLLVKCSMSPVHSRDDHNHEACVTCRAYATLNDALAAGEGQ